MTKEAKLQAAMRILPEWKGYDDELKAFQSKMENERRQAEKEDKEENEEEKGKLKIFHVCSIFF